jgi:hypothetical protein
VSALLAAGLAAGAMFMAITIHDLQFWLEQWDYRKHADD